MFVRNFQLAIQPSVVNVRNWISKSLVKAKSFDGEFSNHPSKEVKRGRGLCKFLPVYIGRAIWGWLQNLCGLYSTTPVPNCCATLRSRIDILRLLMHPPNLGTSQIFVKNIAKSTDLSNWLWQRFWRPEPFIFWSPFCILAEQFYLIFVA